MSTGLDRAVKDILQAITESAKKKTNAYDTQATVKRVDGNTAWVHIPGGVDETPVKLTVDAKEGDVVQVRVGGGKAWITGNQTAPPTDDTQANAAKKRANLAYGLAGKAISTAEEVASDLDELASEVADIPEIDDVTVQYCLSNSNSAFQQYGNWSSSPPAYVAGKYYWTRTVLYDEDGNPTYGTPQYSQDTQLSVETSRAYATTDAHFWYDSTGAYVTNAPKTDYKASASGKYATRVTPTGILQSYGGNLLSAWTSSGIGFYAGDGTTADDSTQLALFGSNVELGNKNGKYMQITDSRINFIDGANSNKGIGGIGKGGGDHSLWIGSKVDDYNYVTIATESDYGYFSVTAEKGSSYYSNDYSVLTMYYNVWSVVLADYNNHYATLQLERSRLIYLSNGQYESDIVFKVDGTYGTVTSLGRFNANDGYCWIGRGYSSGSWTNNHGLYSGESGDWIIHVNNDAQTFLDMAGKEPPTTDAANCRLTSAGHILRYSSSSVRYKHDIKDVSDESLNPHKLYELPVRQFVYNDEYVAKDDLRAGVPIVGFIAEEVAEHYSIAADYYEGLAEDWNARYIVPPMLALIQEQNKRITKLEERLS